MPKIQTWSIEEAKNQLTKRLNQAQQARKPYEKFWQDSEHVVYGTGYNSAQRSNFLSDLDTNLMEVDESDADVNVSYAFKNLRFLHAQMSANPPTCVARPASNDPEDRRRADAADRLIRHAIRTYKMQEHVDRASLQCLLYGSAMLKLHWNPHKGDILDLDDDDNITLEGDIDISVPHLWDIFIDPDAETFDDARYVIQRRILPYEEAVYLWPEKQELLKSIKQDNRSSHSHNLEQGGKSPYIRKELYDTVEIYEYWEKGLPLNGFLGKHAIHTKGGELLEPIKANPHRFKPASDANARYSIARLPFHMLTDIDLPNSYWGKSTIDYAAPIQQTMNRLDSLNLDNIQAHGSARLVLPENAEISEQITNTPWDIVKITGNQAPYFMSAPNTMPAIDRLREQVKIGVDDMFGVNESMFGQQSRETAGFAMQYAANQGNMIRRRLFNKYAMFVEAIYKSYLDVVRKNWDTKRTILVIGKEKALEAVDIQGADISGGFDIVVEYGASLSLDPMTRRQEIQALQPLFEKAGVPVRVTLKMMKLNELEGMYDMMQLSEDRQREIFEEMIATGMYLPPEELEDHENMLAYALQFRMTTEFKYLDEDLKVLIIQHIKDRSALAAQEAAGAPPPGAGQPGMMPGGPGVPGPAPDAGPLPEETTPEGSAPEIPPPENA